MDKRTGSASPPSKRDANAFTTPSTSLRGTVLAAEPSSPSERKFNTSPSTTASLDPLTRSSSNCEKAGFPTDEGAATDSLSVTNSAV